MGGTTEIATGGKPISADNPLAVSATVTATAQTVAKATAAAPAYIEGDANAPLSVDLAGNLRTLASVNASLAAAAHAADPAYTEGSSNGLTTDLSGYLRVLAKLGAGQTISATNFPSAVSVNTGAADNGTLRTTLASGDPLVTAMGAKTDAKNAATDVTAVSAIAILKQLSAYLGSPLGVTGTFWQATQPISAAALPLPAGAATAAKQPALGAAGAASTDVLSIQGIAAMTPLKVDGSATTQPVSLAAAIAVTQSGVWTIGLSAGQSLSVTNLPSAVDVNTGAATNGTLRTTLASNGPALANWGHGATGAAAPANATLSGILAKTALPAAGTDGNLVAPMADKFGRAITRSAPRELLATAALNTTGTSGSLLAAQGAGVFADLYRLIIANSSAAAVLVTISDGTNSYGFEVPANGTAGFSGPSSDATPAAAANTAWTYTVAAGTTTIYISAQFVLNK